MFSKDKFGKILVPVVTPFGDDQEVDLGRLAALVDYLITENKADTLIFTGTTGEFFTMTSDERAAVYQAGVAANAGRLPMIAGVGCASTPETIELGRRALAAGIGTLMVVSPYYTKPSQDELRAHFEAVSKALPEADILLYNIPIFTGVNLEAETVSELAQLPNVVGIKDEAELNPKQITRYLAVTPDDFIIYNGDDTYILETYVQGGADRIGGVISGASHVYGDYIRTMIETFLAGDVATAAKQQQALYPVLRIMGQNGRINPAPLWKSALKLRGIDAGVPRLPLTPGTPGARGHGELRRDRSAAGAEGLSHVGHPGTRCPLPGPDRPGSDIVRRGRRARSRPLLGRGGLPAGLRDHRHQSRWQHR